MVGVASLSCFTTLASLRPRLASRNTNARLLILSVDPFFTYICALWRETSVPNVVLVPDTVEEFVVRCLTAFPYRDDSALAIEWYTMARASRMYKVRRHLEQLSDSSYQSWNHTDLDLTVSTTGRVSGRLFGGVFKAHS